MPIEEQQPRAYAIVDGAILESGRMINSAIVNRAINNGAIVNSAISNTGRCLRSHAAILGSRGDSPDRR